MNVGTIFRRVKTRGSNGWIEFLGDVTWVATSVVGPCITASILQLQGGEPPARFRGRSFEFDRRVDQLQYASEKAAPVEATV